MRDPTSKEGTKIIEDLHPLNPTDKTRGPEDKVTKGTTCPSVSNRGSSHPFPVSFYVRTRAIETGDGHKRRPDVSWEEGGLEVHVSKGEGPKE